MDPRSRILFCKLTRPLKAALGLLFLSTVFPLCAGAQKRTSPQETSGTIVPAPTIFHAIVATATGGQTGFGNQAEQYPSDPTHAHDFTTGQDLYWDADKKTWVDSASGESLGFDGVLTANGTIIPAPPVFHGTVATATGAQPGFGHQAEQDPNDPTLAHDSTTGQNLHWDADKKTWVDSANGQSMGFDGVLTSPPPPQTPGATATPPSSASPSHRTK
jgi:hypothetical protein